MYLNIEPLATKSSMWMIPGNRFTPGAVQSTNAVWWFRGIGLWSMRIHTHTNTPDKMCTMYRCVCVCVCVWSFGWRLRLPRRRLRLHLLLVLLLSPANLNIYIYAKFSLTPFGIRKCICIYIGLLGEGECYNICNLYIIYKAYEPFQLILLLFGSEKKRDALL